MATETTTVVQLDAEESIRANEFVIACDHKADGFRLGMEQAKLMFLRHLVASRKQLPPAAPPPPVTPPVNPQGDSQ